MTASHANQKVLLLWNTFGVASAGHRLSSTFVVQRKKNSRTYESCHPPRSSNRAVVCAAMAIDPNNAKDGEENDADDNSFDQKIDNLLDKPFFDPYAPSNDDNWFANLVRNDYDSAEALYAGAVVIFGVIVSQELLKIVKYGGEYATFNPGDGRLF
jgi:hypothetical protein